MINKTKDKLSTLDKNTIALAAFFAFVPQFISAFNPGLPFVELITDGENYYMYLFVLAVIGVIIYEMVVRHRKSKTE